MLKDDAVARALNATPVSFRWSDLQYNSAAAQRVMQIASADFGMTKGFGVPVHGLNGFEAGLSFSGNDVDDTCEANFSMELIGIYSFNLFAKIGAPTAKPVLTPRQKEVMRWVAAGKNSWEISVILKVSQDTVAKTVTAAMSRLNTCTRAQAIAEAVRLREIYV